MTTEEKPNVNLKGITKAAIILGYLQKETAREVLDHLDSFEQSLLTKALIDLPSFEMGVLEPVVRDYLEYMDGDGLEDLNRGAEFALSLMDGKASPDEIEELMGRIHTGNAKPFDSLKRIRDVAPILAYLQNEDPQTIAVFASYMKPSQGAELLQSLPEEKRVEVAMGIATMEQTNNEVLHQMENHLNKKIQHLISDDESSTDGVKTLVSILNNVNRNTEKQLFTNLEEMDEDLAKTIKDSMFVFEDIIQLDRLAMQELTSALGSENVLIAKALKLASEELKEKFLSSMSEGRRALLKDEEEGLGRIKASEAEEAQQKIARVVKELEEQGKIIIQRGEDDVIL